ncbi:hypothetical protein Hanom_Chr02g00169661 [Helianthus anomalus]
MRIPSKPHSRKMSPTELPLHNISRMLKHITNTDRMITSTPVILRPFVLRRVLASVTPISTVTSSSIGIITLFRHG